MSTPGERIRQERIRRKMSIPELSKATGVAQRTIGRVERGERDSDMRFLLEEYLGIPRDTEQTGTYTIEQALAAASHLQLLNQLGDRLERLDRAENLPTTSFRLPLNDAPSRRHADNSNVDDDGPDTAQKA